MPEYKIEQIIELTELGLPVRVSAHLVKSFDDWSICDAIRKFKHLRKCHPQDVNAGWLLKAVINK